MKRFLLLALTARFLSPIAANAELTFEEKRKTCAFYSAGQITRQSAADKLGLKKSIHKDHSKKELIWAVIRYCKYLGGYDW